MKSIESDIPLIDVTGGPCSGKTSLMAVAPQKIEDRGRDAYPGEETATFMIKQGMRLKKALREKRWGDVREYQKELMASQFENEERLKRCAAREGRPAAILCDRGLPDSRAYLPEGREGEDMYAALLREATGLDPAQALDRYVAVVKLTTAANGAEEFYTLENNAARDETPEQARYLDRRIEDAYNGHQHLRVIDNPAGGTFEAKITRALHAIYRALGIPEPLEIERKYRVSYPCLDHFPVPYRKVKIEQIYLRSERPDEEVRIRRREHANGSTYFMTRKRQIAPGVRIETEKMIDWRAYTDLRAASRDPLRSILTKERRSFLWKNQHFELDVFTNLPMTLCLLEIELTDLQQEVSLPPFLGLHLEDEVTRDPRYNNYALAKSLADWQKRRSSAVPDPPFVL